jgi:voltage-gated potassium channel
MSEREEQGERGGDEAGRSEGAGRGQVGGGGADAGGREESAGMSERDGGGDCTDRTDRTDHTSGTGGTGGTDRVGREESREDSADREAAADDAATARQRGLSRLPAPARVAVAILGPLLLTTAYFTIPFGVLGPHHRILSWVILAGLLTLLAVGMVVTTNRVLTDTTGRYRHPGLGFLLLSWAAILVFAASYWAMATRQGQFVGLQTRLDALYFTGVTMATVGYGDVHPSGQVARAVVLVQLVYTFAFLVGGITALRTRARATVVRRLGRGK